MCKVEGVQGDLVNMKYHCDGGGGCDVTLVTGEPER